MSKRKQTIDPPRHEAPTGTRWRDPATGRRWIMTDHGWELPKAFQFDVLTRDKSRWVRAAQQEGLPLEEWATNKLNTAADLYRPEVTAKELEQLDATKREIAEGETWRIPNAPRPGRGIICSQCAQEFEDDGLHAWCVKCRQRARQK